jgi:hypothetical protein
MFAPITSSHNFYTTLHDIMKFQNAKYVALLAASPSSYALASSNAIVEKKPDEGLRGVGQRELKVKTCSKEKRVQVYRFCIEGDCDAGAEGEHRLKLDGQWLWGGFRDFREGQCHSINHSAKTVAAWKSLAVGTEEHDDWSENDSWFATMTASDWYSETCETYEVILSKQHAAQKKESMCWEMSAAGGAKGVDLGLTATRCSEWTKPSESFLWYLKVEPKGDVSYITYRPTSSPTDSPTPLPTTPPTLATLSPTDAPSLPPTEASGAPSDFPSLPPTDVPPPTPTVVSVESSLLGTSTSASSHASLNAKIVSLVIGLLGALVYLG